MIAQLILRLFIAHADAMVCQDHNQELCVIPVSQGEACPFSGELLTYKLALQLKQKADHCEVELSEQKKADKADMQLRIDTDQAIRRADQTQFETTMLGCEKQLQEQQKLVVRCEPPWWQKPVFLVPVVALGTMLTTAWVTIQVVR